jgi:hypothetical protein
MLGYPISSPRFVRREVFEVGILGFAGLGGIVPELSLACSKAARFGRGWRGWWDFLGFSGGLRRSYWLRV